MKYEPPSLSNDFLIQTLSLVISEGGREGGRGVGERLSPKVEPQLNGEKEREMAGT